MTVPIRDLEVRNDRNDSAPRYVEYLAEEEMFEGLLQPMHLIVILVAGLFLFGPKKLPELGRGLGEGIRGFKNALNNIQKPNSSDEV
jgi:TatA/E family protein of Tat protein translocase